MDSNQPPPSSAHLFSIFLDENQDEILKRWRQSVVGDERIPSAAKLPKASLYDHFPQILGELQRFLNQHQNAEPSERIDDDAETHGNERWAQGFSLEEVLLEIERLRKMLLLDVVYEFAAARDDIDITTVRQISDLVYEFFQVVIIGAAVEHTEASDEQLRAHARLLDDMNLGLRERNDALRVESDQIREMSFTDPLTGIANRRSFEEALQRQIERAHRYCEPLSIVMIDLDHFKTVNDNHGHEAGDNVLRSVADTLTAHSRGMDLAARYGGEEFLLLLPKTEIRDAEALVERLRLSLSETLVEPLSNPVTGTFGLAQWVEGEDMHNLIGRADDAMYRAKQAGRNRSHTSTPE